MIAPEKNSPPSDPARVVRLTPSGRGAVAVVLVEGPRATELVAACFRSNSGRALADVPVGRIALGRWGGPEGEELIVCRRGPHRVEVHPHAGHAAALRVVEDLERLGAVELSWQQWVQETEGCPLAADARIALAEAPTRRAAAVLLDQFHGALRRDVERVIELVQTGDVSAAKDALTALRELGNLGAHLVHPWRIVLAGPPNVGKSSLVNALVGYQRAIVYDQPGTTRDVVSARTAIDGWTVELSDTAGLRTSSDPLEAAGVRLARQLLSEADAVIFVLDATWSTAALERRLSKPQATARRALVAINKADLVDGEQRAAIEAIADDRAWLTSAHTREGIDSLLNVIVKLLVPKPPAPGDGVPFLPPHCRQLDAALAQLDRRDAQSAVCSLQDLLDFRAVWESPPGAQTQ